MKKIVKLLLLFLAFGALSFAQTITVAAAANLKYTVADIAKEFTKSTGIRVNVTTGSSGKLTQQIMAGAPFDAFLSADTSYPEKLAQAGYTTTPSTIYAYGVLVLWTNSGLNLSDKIAAIKNAKKIAIANPKVAPYGVAAVEAMQHYGIYNSVSKKLVNGESIGQVATFITTKSADVGFMAKSIVMSPDMRGVGKWVELDSASYSKIGQAMVGLKNGSPESQIAAKKFLKFMLSSKAKEILIANGYIVPK